MKGEYYLSRSQLKGYIFEIIILQLLECNPGYLFKESDEGFCEVYYEYVYRRRYFYLTISGDMHRNKYYFTPPKSLDEAATFGNIETLNEKERLFKAINVNINLDNINRNLILKINGDWLENIRKSS